MAREPRGGKAPAPAPAGRQEFELDEQRAESLRAAIDADGDVEFWQRMGAELNFEPTSIVITSLPDTGPVKFTALPPGAADDATAGKASEPAPPRDESEDSDEDQDDLTANRGLELMEEAAEGLDLDSSTLVGDLTAGIWNIVQNLQKPVSAHSQFEKRELHDKIEHIAKIVARQAVDVVAADDRITVKAMLDKITIADKVTINLTLGAMSEDDKAEAISQLFHAQKKPVLIVTADADRHMGKRREIIPPDEEELPFDAGMAGDKPQPQPGPEGDADLAEAGEGGEAAPVESEPTSAD